MRTFVAAAVATVVVLPAVASAGARAKPDLVEQQVATASTQVAAGASFTATDLVRNRGAAAARASLTRFFLRSGGTSIAVGARRVPALKPRQSSSAVVRLTLPAAGASAGTFALVACVDATRAVAEASEQNNCSSASRRLAVAAPAAPPAGTTTTAPPPATTAPPTTADADRDGTADSADCAPRDASIHPGAPDLPDVAFVDSNCDGIDGDAAKSIFVSTGGQDASPGTRDRPKRTIAAAVAAANERAVLVAAGTYDEGAGVELRDNTGIYGGYASGNWARANANATVIAGSPQAVLADGDTGVVLQLLTLRGTAPAAPGQSAYAVRAIGSSKLQIERSVLQAGDGRAGAAGAKGAAGADGRPGGDGAESGISHGGGGGAGGTGARFGGNGGGGAGDADHPGGAGVPGSGQAGGAAGAGGTSGRNPTNGQAGSPGGDGTAVGFAGTGGTNGTEFAGSTWRGRDGSSGGAGAAGSGGGGGGGGGFRISGIGRFDLYGGGGGGGGGGGAGGAGGGGGQAGGGSFGVYLVDSAVTLASGTVVKPGAGSAGGDGGLGGAPGRGGAGGGAKRDNDNTLTPTGGPGAQGGSGAQGGRGGGGAGGPSIGVFKRGTSTLVLGSDVAITPAAGGKGGAGAAAGQDGTSAKLFPPA